MGGKPLNSDDRTRIGSGSEEYVHIAYEQDMEDKAFIRKDFRETWLFDIVILNKRFVHSNYFLKLNHLLL